MYANIIMKVIHNIVYYILCVITWCTSASLHKILVVFHAIFAFIYVYVYKHICYNNISLALGFKLSIIKLHYLLIMILIQMATMISIINIKVIIYTATYSFAVILYYFLYNC